MQSICLWACNDLGVHAALPAPRAVALDDAARRRILFLTSCSVDYRSLAGALAAGARARGGERKAYRHVDGGRGDVYLTVMRAVALDPPRLALPYAELGERLRALCDGEVPDGASVVRAPVHAGQVAAATTPGAPPLEWDEDAQTLVLADPYLLFYLRWSGFLVRAAGDDA